MRERVAFCRYARDGWIAPRGSLVSAIYSMSVEKGGVLWDFWDIFQSISFINRMAVGFDVTPT